MKNTVHLLASALLIASILITSIGCNTPMSKPNESDGKSEMKESNTEYENSLQESETDAPGYIGEDGITDFITSAMDIDKLLERPYDGDVPTAFSEGIFALHSNSWGFDNDSIFETGNSIGVGMPISVEINGKAVKYDSAVWHPSHIVSTFKSAVSTGTEIKTNIASTAKVSATFTSQYDPDGLVHLVDEIISYEATPRNRWSNYISTIRTQPEMLTFDFGCDSLVTSVTVYPFDDGGATVLPQKINVEYFADGEWSSVSDERCGDIKKNTAVEITFDAVNTEKLRIIITPQSGKAVGITELAIMGSNVKALPLPEGITVEEKKFVTSDDFAASLITVINESNDSIEVTVAAVPSVGFNECKFGYGYVMFGCAELSQDSGEKKVTLAAGESYTFKNALAFAGEKGDAKAKLDAFAEDNEILEKHIKKFAKWFKDNIPYFDCDDEEILKTYYFRWLTYRNHIRKINDTWDGYIISEFLPNVSWSGKFNSISCPAGHHFYEGRWIKESKYLDSYQEFWFIDGADPALYSFAIADAYYNRYLVTGDKEELIKYLEELDKNYIRWETSKFLADKGLFTQLADRDGMELGVGGDGLRPTINSYMYGDAVAIARIARMVGNDEIAEKYEKKAGDLKTKIMETLWNENEGFFETVKSIGISTNVRELIGYVPWYYNLPDDSETYSKAFAQLLDEEGFLSPYGPTTVEQREPRFKITYGAGCRWDGPSWPFATSQTITAAANLLNNYKENSVFESGDWFDMLKTYARSQYKDGYSWIGEDLDPITGKWIVDLPRSVHYNHSTFTDLVITGLVGIRPDDSDESLTVNPLFDKGDLEYFVLENVSYRGRNITVVYDENGDRYELGNGMFVFVDGRLAATSETLSSITVDLAQ